MIRATIVLAAALSALAIGPTYAGQAHKQDKYQKIQTCKAKIAPKGLKGAAFKDEMKKCTINPDFYN